MPGFENAAALVQQHAVLSGVVGVRLNFSEGYSLTSAIRSCRRFCHRSGSFTLHSGRRLLLLSSGEKKAVYEEMKAQLEKALMAGIRPSHLDTHHSLHGQWPVAVLLAKLGRESALIIAEVFGSIGGMILFLFP